MSRLVFHVDVNSAFLSWEAARRVAQGEKDLQLIPSAIGGDRDKRTGVILAKSIPAKRFGVTTGEPVAMALRKCPELYLAKPDFRLYEKSSKAFMDICRAYAPVVEKYSIDECFLDMSGTEHIYPDPVAIATKIKNEIRDKLGFTVNIGISTNKLLAKMASDFEKPDKVHTLYPEELETKLWSLPVRELFSVGRSTADKLQRFGVQTIGMLAKTQLSLLQSLLGVKMGQQLHNYANGVDDSPVLAEPEEAKCYGVSTTLEEDIITMEAASQVLLLLADSVTSRMRADGVQTGCISVTIRGNDFKNRAHQRKLNEPTDVTDEVIQVSRQLFAELWNKQTPLRLLGITLSQLTHGDAVQLSLFSDVRKKKAQKVDKAVDVIRGRFGSKAIMRGSSIQSSLEVGKKYKAQLELDHSDDR